MKKVMLCVVIFLGAASFTSASAQIKANPSSNNSSQPSWGPRGYDYVEYYYLPDIEVYYHVPSHQFIYRLGKNWVSSSSLPSEHSNYDLYSGYKVVINEEKAYLNFEQHKVKYARLKGTHGKPLLFRKNNEPRQGYMLDYRPRHSRDRQ